MITVSLHGVIFVPALTDEDTKLRAGGELPQCVSPTLRVCCGD